MSASGLVYLRNKTSHLLARISATINFSIVLELMGLSSHKFML